MCLAELVQMALSSTFCIVNLFMLTPLCLNPYRNLFKSENVYKDKEDTVQTVSKSIQTLQHDFGGQDNLFMNLRTDISVSA